MLGRLGRAPEHFREGVFAHLGVHRILKPRAFGIRKHERLAEVERNAVENGELRRAFRAAAHE